MAKQPIKVYALSTCSQCKAVTKLLAWSNLEFEVVEVDRLDNDQRKDMLAEARQYNPRLSFPTTVIGDAVVVASKADLVKNFIQEDLY